MSIRAHPHVADANPHAELGLPRHAALLVHRHAPNILPGQAATHQTPAPGRKLGTRVLHQPARGRARGPRHNRVHHVGQSLLVTDGRAAVFVAVSSQGPAVVAARNQDVQFIPAARAVFIGKDAPFGIHRQALDVAVAVRVDQRVRARLAHKGVIRRSFSIRIHAQNFAVGGAEILGVVADVLAVVRTRRVPPVADAEEQGFVRQERHSRTEVLAARLIDVRFRQHLEVGNGGATQRAAGQCRAVRPFVTHRIGEENVAVLGKVRVHHDVHQAALPNCGGNRQ